MSDAILMNCCYPLANSVLPRMEGKYMEFWKRKDR